MAKKKDFESINTGKVYDAIEQATGKKGQQGTASLEEQAARAAELKTQGRKGCKATRINMAFTPDNYEFIKIVARIHGQSMTEFANQVIKRYREEHPETYEKAKELIASFDDE